jgi:hypothetical protein
LIIFRKAQNIYFYFYFFDTNETSSLQEVKYNTLAENGLEMLREPEGEKKKKKRSRDGGEKP